MRALRLGREPLGRFSLQPNPVLQRTVGGTLIDTGIGAIALFGGPVGSEIAFGLDAIKGVIELGMARCLPGQ